MDIILNEIEVRVLGCLMEKALSTPEHYPLSLNALTNACNQKTSRDPVVSYDEATVQSAVHDLTRKNIVSESNVSRVPKYEELLSQKNTFIPRESAALCVLLLRGPQTIGEIRTRTSRMCTFEGLQEVQETLGNLVEWGFIRRLERLPGHKESRYGHLLAVETDVKEEAMDLPTNDADSDLPERIEKLERTVESLQKELIAITKEFRIFKEQFD